jgi:hypothetical protein
LICGCSSNNTDSFNGLHFRGNVVTSDDFPDVFNSYLKSISDGVPQLRISAEDDVVSCTSISSDTDISEFYVSEFDVYMVLCKLNVSKSSLGDVIDNRLLKSLADILAAPICALINNSLSQGIVPTQWKIARVTPLPKCTPVRDIATDLRPIAITCPVSKVAEFFTAKLFDEFFDDSSDQHQFGNVAGRSTTLALIKFTHLLFESSDNSCNIIRCLFVDFSRAFDLINHNIVSTKLDSNYFPLRLRNWFLSFLNNREQFVKINDRVSDCVVMNAGAPQGTRAGPNCFKLLIKDLTFRIPFIKYVDDVSVVSVSDDIHDDSLEQSVVHLLTWCGANGMHLNVNKTKEMICTFGKRVFAADCSPLLVDGVVIERVQQFKLLGVIISSDLSWKYHVKYIISKASKRLFAICHLMRCGFPIKDIVDVYCALIRPVLEYASPVWHCGLTKSLSDDIERVQQRCLRIVLPLLSYSDALVVSGLQRLSVRREAAVISIFNDIKKQSHVLHHLLPVEHSKVGCHTRNAYPYRQQIHRTNRSSHSLITYCIQKRL